MSQVSTAEQRDEPAVNVEVDYLPATTAFKEQLDDKTQIGVVRGDATAFFKVADHTDRNQHRFFLEFEGRRLTDPGQTLEQVAGRDRRHMKFTLIEEITPGSRA